jgi:hypothetical protein
MAMLCAVHCLLTPILIVFLPIITTTFWVHENFHMWMVLFVVPTTGAAVFMGCKKHKDRAVLLLSIIGISVLASVAAYETIVHSQSGVAGHAYCPDCVGGGHPSAWRASTLINVMGGILLASAHVRNFLLCRQAHCTHEH